MPHDDERDLDAPATKRDVLELRNELRHDLEMLGVKIDAYWTASERVQRLAFAVLAAGVAAMVAAAVTLMVKG
jgi:hypothetical protein